MINVRKAKLADVPRIAQIHVASWRAAYDGQLPPGFLDSIDPSHRAAMWRSCVKNNGKLWVAERPEDGIVGFACLGPPSDPDMPDATELKAIYLDPPRYGLGLGTELWREIEGVVDTVAVYLWVLSSNERGKAFYAKNGFAPDGRTKGFRIAQKRFHESRYVKRLVP